MKLKNTKNERILFEKLIYADTPKALRTGLLGKESLSNEEAMYFPKGIIIHTFFMKFAIDCVFVDKKGMIRKICHDVKPWRFAGPVWGAPDVIEMASGVAKLKGMKVGDIIECGL